MDRRSIQIKRFRDKVQKPEIIGFLKDLDEFPGSSDTLTWARTEQFLQGLSQDRFDQIYEYIMTIVEISSNSGEDFEKALDWLKIEHEGHEFTYEEYTLHNHIRQFLRGVSPQHLQRIRSVLYYIVPIRFKVTINEVIESGHTRLKLVKYKNQLNTWDNVINVMLNLPEEDLERFVKDLRINFILDSCKGMEGGLEKLIQILNRVFELREGIQSWEDARQVIREQLPYEQVLHLYKNIGPLLDIRSTIPPAKVRARVFISCGQNTDEEKKISNKIHEILEELGFEPYVAVQEQTLRGIKENIFQMLGESEYFLFIDFKREHLFDEGEPKNSGLHRGSLFSHQELALATYLDLEVLAFQEEGVKKLDGILHFIQANCIPFENRDEIPALVSKMVIERGWRSDWRNQLVFDRNEEKDYVKAHGKVQVRGVLEEMCFFHVRVKNLHRSRIAHNCVCYLEGIRNLATDQMTEMELVELKWKGVVKPEVSVPPQKERLFDAFYILLSTPQEVYLGINSSNIDFTKYYDDFKLGPGDYELHFIVFSVNFAPSKAIFQLHIGPSLEDISFVKKE